MVLRFLPPFALVALLTLSGCASQEGDEAAHAAGAHPFAFLEGHWMGVGGEAVGLEAVYAPTVSGGLLGFSRVRDGEEDRWIEFEVFDPTPSGVVLRPFPGGKPAVTLALASLTASRVVFTNPEKDFPTEISYERTGPDELRIVLDDPGAIRSRTESLFDVAKEFLFRRIEAGSGRSGSR